MTFDAFTRAGGTPHEWMLREALTALDRDDVRAAIETLSTAALVAATTPGRSCAVETAQRLHDMVLERVGAPGAGRMELGPVPLAGDEEPTAIAARKAG